MSTRTHTGAHADTDAMAAEAAAAPIDEASLAIVPFSLSSPFASTVQLPKRTIPLAGRDWHISQHYVPDGRGGTALGFGASIYDAEIVLADYLSRHDSVCRGKYVVEIGAGLALASMVASEVCGAARVVATDGDPMVVDMATATFAENSCAATAQKLLWGCDVDMDAVGSPDVIIAADIVAAPYEEHLPALADTLHRLYTKSAAAPRLLLAYQRRHGVERKWFHRMRDLGYIFDEIARDELHPDFRTRSSGQLSLVQLFHIHR